MDHLAAASIDRKLDLAALSGSLWSSLGVLGGSFSRFFSGRFSLLDEFCVLATGLEIAVKIAILGLFELLFDVW